MVITCCELKWLKYLLRDLRVLRTLPIFYFVIIRQHFIFLPIIFFTNAQNMLRSIVTLCVISSLHSTLLRPTFLLTHNLWISSPKFWATPYFTYSWKNWASVIYTLQLEGGIEIFWISTFIDDIFFEYISLYYNYFITFYVFGKNLLYTVDRNIIERILSLD